MRWRNSFLALLALAAASCDGGSTSKAVLGRCTLDLTKSPDGTVAVSGDCPRDAEGVGAAIERGRGMVTSAGEIALGRTHFRQEGVFDRRKVMARLADDPRWTISINSNTAAAPLREALQAETLARPIVAALSSRGRSTRGVSLEKVLLSDGSAKDCPKAPVRAPVEAQIWLLLG